MPLTIMIVLALILAVFFAMNMGGSGMSPAFAAPYGAGVIGRKKAALLFGVFVLLGAYLAGGKVVETISKGIVPQEVIDIKVAMIVLSAAAVSLFISNMFKVAVSTSSVTVFSLVSVGLYFGQLNTSILVRIFSFWITLPLVAYGLTFTLGKLILPLENSGFIDRHQKILKGLVLAVGCYVAFSVGSNNVANAVGPLVGSKLLSAPAGVLMIAPFFGVGGYVFRRVLDTVGKEITGLGILGAAINGTVIGTLLLISSVFGMPEPMVMLDATSIMGIGSANQGHKFIITRRVVRKILCMWVVSPLIAFGVTFGLLFILH